MKQEIPQIWSYDLYEDGMNQVGLIYHPDHIQGQWVKLSEIDFCLKADRTNADLLATCNFMESQMKDVREAVIGWDSESAFLCGPDDHSCDKAIGRVYHDISQQIRAILDR